jgi:hypothetical protein
MLSVALVANCCFANMSANWHNNIERMLRTNHCDPYRWIGSNALHCTSVRQRDRQVEHERDRERRDLDIRRAQIRKDEARNDVECLFGEKIKDLHCTWDEAQRILKGRDRFETRELSTEEKHSLFVKHIAKLKQVCCTHATERERERVCVCVCVW